MRCSISFKFKKGLIPMSHVFNSIVSISLLASGLCISGESSSSKTTTVEAPSTISTQTALVQQFFNAYSSNNVSELSQIMAKDYSIENASDIHEITYSKYSEMSKNIKVRASAMHKALPNFSLDVKEVFSNGNKVFAKTVISGLQKGQFLGTVPSNKPIHIHIYSVFTIKNDKIVKISEMWNELSIMKQLGCVVL